MSFTEYATTQAGLGVWDTTTDVKLSIQFVANDYIGSLLPELRVAAGTGGSNGYIHWNNTGKIVITSPLAEDQWINSRHISSSSGVAYQDLVTYLIENFQDFSIYQPVSVVRPSSEKKFNASSSSSLQGNTDTGIGTIVIVPQNSYSFLNAMLKNLANFGCNLKTFLQVYISFIFHFLLSLFVCLFIYLLQCPCPIIPMKNTFYFMFSTNCIVLQCTCTVYIIPHHQKSTRIC